MTPRTRVLVVDDSAFVRKVVREMLACAPELDVVGTARDGAEALELVESVQPDVITCDLSMPNLDGIGFVREQMRRRRLPILILTASPLDGEKALEALNAGAVDFLQKPNALATDELLGIREDLVEKVKAAARAPLRNLAPSAVGTSLAPPTRPAGIPKVDIVVIGISTGGPQGLRYMLPELPASFPVPIAMVLHMPIGYTALFAEKLDEICQIEVVEAKEGDVARPGVALLAPAGRHLTLRRNLQGAIVAHLSIQPMDRAHRPAVDVLFQSATEIFGGRVLGVVMTGMGDDGTQGAGWIKAQGGTVFTEAEKSCIIYGMPRSVVEAGLSDRAIPLEGMAKAISDFL